MIYELPTTVEIQGIEYQIRSDYRPILDICIAFSDPNLSNEEKAIVAMDIFYPEFSNMPVEHYQDAIEKCCSFINCGDNDSGQKSPKLVDWEQDFQYIIAPINRVVGKEVRSLEYMHWWTFISCYREIGGDCVFSQIVRIRDMLARGKKLEKQDREWLRQNRSLVEFKTKYTSTEEEFFENW